MLPLINRDGFREVSHVQQFLPAKQSEFLIVQILRQKRQGKSLNQ